MFDCAVSFFGFLIIRSEVFVRYGDSFYRQVTSPKTSLYTVVCVDRGLIVGAAVARVESQWRARVR